MYLGISGVAEKSLGLKELIEEPGKANGPTGLLSVLGAIEIFFKNLDRAINVWSL